MSKEIHVWVGDEDPYALPHGEVTIVIHQGWPPQYNSPAAEPTGPRVSPGDEAQPVAGTQQTGPSGDEDLLRVIREAVEKASEGLKPVQLKNPTPGRSPYIDLVHGVHGADPSTWIPSIVAGRAGPEIGIELPDFTVGGTGGREVIFKSLLDNLHGKSASSDIKVHLIVGSDLPSTDD